MGSALFVTLGLAFVGVQADRLLVWYPVPATVVGQAIDTVSGRGGPTYEPLVAYRYFVNGRWYSHNRVYPLSESRSYDWALRVTQQYAVGASTIAYVDRARPQDAFLVRQFDPLPLVPLGFGLVSGSIALTIRRRRQARNVT